MNRPGLSTALLAPDVWVMADLMLRRGGMTDPSKEDRRRYQALRLGRSDGETLLTELLPYPSPGVNDWLYKRYGRYSTRETYTAAMLGRRQLSWPVVLPRNRLIAIVERIEPRADRARAGSVSTQSDSDQRGHTWSIFSLN